VKTVLGNDTYEILALSKRGRRLTRLELLDATGTNRVFIDIGDICNLLKMAAGSSCEAITAAVSELVDADSARPHVTDVLWETESKVCCDTDDPCDCERKVTVYERVRYLPADGPGHMPGFVLGSRTDPAAEWREREPVHLPAEAVLAAARVLFSEAADERAALLDRVEVLSANPERGERCACEEPEDTDEYKIPPLALPCDHCDARPEDNECGTCERYQAMLDIDRVTDINHELYANLTAKLTAERAAREAAEAERDRLAAELRETVGLLRRSDDSLLVTGRRASIEVHERWRSDVASFLARLDGGGR